jgi:hypothetical protein
MPHRSGNEDLAPFGYAPGFSHFYCIDCNDMTLTPGHQHSIRCIRHAITEKRKLEAAAPPAEVLQEEPIACSQSSWIQRLFSRFVGRGTLQISG